MAAFTGPMGWASNFDRSGGPFWVPALQAQVLTGEHGFNALKTRDPLEQAHVLAAATPAEAKRRGRRVTLRSDWDAGARVAAMDHVLEAKFSLPTMASKLLATGDLPLVETNHWHDQFWGDCTCPRHQAVPGVNMLGQLLMKHRTLKRGL